MFGMENKGKGKALFEFDLEKDIKADPAKAKTLSKAVEEKIVDIKHALRSGADAKNFENLGILLHGYSALQRVIGRITNKK